MEPHIDPSDWRTIAALLLAINCAAFTAFALDKAAARRGSWRIRESTLLGLALVGGIVGALAGQRLLRHKTRKEPFRTRLYGIGILQAVFVIVLAVPSVRSAVLGVIAAAAG